MDYEKTKQQYDSLYGNQSDITFGAGQTTRVVSRLPQYLSSGSVYDVGGGDGRNSLFLANLGYDVTVQDISSVGIQKVIELAAREGSQVETEVSDITKTTFSKSYDAFIFSFVLHHLSVDDAKELLRKTIQHTSEEGVHLIATFGSTGGLYERNEFKNRFYPSIAELTDMYADWEILESGSKVIGSLAKDKRGNHLQNEMIAFVARKVH